LDLELAAGELLQPKQDAVAMETAERHCFEDQHVQRPLQQINLFAQRPLLVCLGETIARTLLGSQGENVFSRGWRGLVFRDQNILER